MPHSVVHPSSLPGKPEAHEPTGQHSGEEVRVCKWLNRLAMLHASPWARVVVAREPRSTASRIIGTGA
jgi:hypothetical protein